MRLAHDPTAVASLRSPTADDPWRILVSGCLHAWPCAIDGTDYGLGPALGWLRALPTARVVPFCPEEHGIGVPRGMPDLHGGDGFAVLAGRARVLDEHGTDLTPAMVRGARAMVQRALRARAELAILVDMSGACGTQVISDGCRYDDPRRFQVGVGVAAAALLQAGVAVVAQRDHRTLGLLRARLDPGFRPDPTARDHHQGDWYVETFGSTAPGGR
ncbi:MAG: DUF523 domain-containing protein [Alphaproteobacteria bacterium]|nr:DUF523 domain-containing protein [Alphaproteobacteria bacterium]